MTLYRLRFLPLDTTRELVTTKDYMTLVEVNWRLHVVAEEKLARPGCLNSWSNVDGLPALLVGVYREKEDIRYE